MLRDRSGGARLSTPAKIFSGVHFVLFGFDSVSEAQYRSELLDGGGVDVSRYDSSCTHVIVSGRVLDEPICVAARNDGKVLVTELWIDDSLSLGFLADSTKVLYRPVRDLSGIPGSESLHICLTGYQRQERDDIMRMVSLMGGRFSKPLIANQVTHLICYKFEGEKYELAKKVNIKLVNHRWLEDCLKAWEILPIDYYKRSGWELEILEAKALDSEEEAEDAGKRVTEQRTVAESHSLRGEMPSTLRSGSLMEDARIAGVTESILAAKQSDLSNNNLLINAPLKDNYFGKNNDIYNTNIAEKLPDSHGMGIINGKQANTPDLVDFDMKCHGFSSNARNSSMGMTSCEEDMKLGTFRTATKQAVSPKDQFSNFGTPHSGKLEEINVKGDANISSTESKDATETYLNHNLHGSAPSLDEPLAEQTNALPKKRKLSVPKTKSKSIKPNQVLKSGLLDPPKSFNSVDRDFLKPQQIESEDLLFHNETSASIRPLVENNDAFPQTERLSVSSACPSFPELAQKDSGTCINHRPSSTMRPEQVESASAQHYEMVHGLVHTDSFAGTAFVHSMENQQGRSPKTSSINRKRKFLKPRNSASVSNMSSNSSSMMNSKDELPSVPSYQTLDAAYDPLFGVGTDETVQAENGSTGNDLNFLLPPLAGDGGNADEVLGNVRAQGECLNSRKSSAAKAQNLDGLSLKYETEIRNDALEQQERPGEDEEGVPSASKDSKVKSSAIIENSGSSKSGEAHGGTIRCELLASSRGRKPKQSGENCKNKSSKDSLRSLNSNKAAIKSEKAEKEDSPLLEEEMEQRHSTDCNSVVIEKDKIHLDRVKENGLKGIHDLVVKEDNVCDPKEKKNYKSHVGAKHSSADSNISFSKQSNRREVIPEPMWFILSGHRSQRTEFKKIIKQLRGRICKDSHNWAYEATHFIVPDYVRRTQKFFAAAASGRWILRSDYLTACGEAGKFVDEESYEWHKKGLTEDGAISLEAPRKWRNLRERTGHGAFYGMRIIIYGDCIAPPLDTLKRAVKAGNGTILATSPPYTRSLKSGIDFAVVGTSMPSADIWVQEFLKHEIPCVLPDYLVEYVCKPGYSLDKHVLYNTHKWAEKSFSALVTRSETVPSENLSDENGLDRLQCVVCGSPDREEVMLICGNEARTIGCGVGTHIDCCDPPLAAVPEDDWLCRNCRGNSGAKAPAKTTKTKRKKGKR